MTIYNIDLTDHSGIIPDGYETNYKLLEIKLLEIGGVYSSVLASRLPMMSGHKSDSYFEHGNFIVGEKDQKLLSKLIRAGDEHAKAIRGIDAYFELKFSLSWMPHLMEYRVGTDSLSTSSAMHLDLGGMKGIELAEKKQDMASGKYYIRIQRFSYQALRRIYLQRKTHRHPDWTVFCRAIEQLPYFNEFIMPDKK